MTQRTINTSEWSDEQIAQAKQIWAEYQRSHDVNDRKGQSAGIDPETGDVWFGADIIDIARNGKRRG